MKVNEYLTVNLVVTGDRYLAPAGHCFPVGRSVKEGIYIALLDIAVEELGVI
jgi:hypothetical protein